MENALKESGKRGVGRCRGNAVKYTVVFCYFGGYVVMLFGCCVLARNEVVESDVETYDSYCQEASSIFCEIKQIGVYFLQPSMALLSGLTQHASKSKCNGYDVLGY